MNVTNDDLGGRIEMFIFVKDGLQVYFHFSTFWKKIGNRMSSTQIKELGVLYHFLYY